MDYEKLNKRIDHMFKYETDNFFVNINLKNEVAEKLFDYQIMHVFNLMTALRHNNCILDSSATGTGKTYSAIALCKQLNLRPFIICPKTIMTQWKNVCKVFDVRPLGIVNYELIKNGKYYNRNGEKVECDFIEVKENDNDVQFKWKLPHYALLIFDEVHKCKNLKTINAQLLLSTKNLRKVLLISATLSDKAQSFHIFGYMLGCYKKLSQARNWINGMLREDKLYIGPKEQYLSAINRYLYPNKGSRMRIEELGDKFPENQICADSYYLEDAEREEVNRAFRNILENKEMIKSALDKETHGKILDEILKARMKIELAKIPIFEELINDYIENGFAVVVFLNFIEPIKQLAKKFKNACVIRGGQSVEQRQENIDKFQSNQSSLIIVSGSISDGLNLHDENGNFPRVSLISPPMSSQALVQDLGRIFRQNCKSKCLQRLIFAADTIEEIICNKLKNKLQFLSSLNDDDLVNID
jgi:superfamily II DNA or RNA helicase